MFFANSDRTAPEADRRIEQRTRTLRGGTLRFNRGYGAMECVVRSVSAHGARLTFGDTLAVPSRFELRVGPDGVWRTAEVRWRTVTDVGVELT